MAILVHKKTMDELILISDIRFLIVEETRKMIESRDKPFVKVEATKFTEVGYVRKDANAIIEHVVQHAPTLMKKRKKKKKKLYKQSSTSVNGYNTQSIIW